MSVKRTLKYIAFSIAFVSLLAVLCLTVYRSRVQQQIAKTRAIHSSNGINTLERVSIGGIDQWIQIRGQSVQNPILLFIHGGPGTAFIPIAGGFQGPWEKYFTMVQWDQRGAGKTFTSNSKDVLRRTMNIDRMNADTLEIVNYLRTRFSREKIFVLGHSWGSLLGLQLAHDHPELLYAYIGVGQAISSRENEAVLYKDTLQEARRTLNQKAITALTSMAPYPSAAVTFDQVRTLREWSGILLGPPGSEDSLMGPTTILYAPEYSLINDVDWFRGQLFSINLLLNELEKADLGALGYEYHVPIFMLEGKHDPYTPSSIAKEFFDKATAPIKLFVWFESSGHFPFSEEPAKFTDTLVQMILPIATQSPTPRQSAHLDLARTN